jgi:hypothetical protein
MAKAKTQTALKVRTTSGKPFHRCGLVFGAEWTVVPGDKLKEKFGSPKTTRKSPAIGDILQADKMLICLEAEEPAAVDTGDEK